LYIYIKKIPKKINIKFGKKNKRAKVNLCDLAGSEKMNKHENIGEAHFNELKNIN
jgi:hypothetical protein